MLAGLPDSGRRAGGPANGDSDLPPRACSLSEGGRRGRGVGGPAPCGRLCPGGGKGHSYQHDNSTVSTVRGSAEAAAGTSCTSRPITRAPRDAPISSSPPLPVAPDRCRGSATTRPAPETKTAPSISRALRVTGGAAVASRGPQQEPRPNRPSRPGRNRGWTTSPPPLVHAGRIGAAVAATRAREAEGGSRGGERG